MIDVESSIDILREKGEFSSREDLLDEAIWSFLRENPELRVELAVEQYTAGTISLNRAAEIAGLGPEEFKDALATRGIDRQAGFLDDSDRDSKLDEL